MIAQEEAVVYVEWPESPTAARRREAGLAAGWGTVVDRFQEVFSAKVERHGNELRLMTWRRAFVSVEGRSYEGAQLLPAGFMRIRKNGKAGAVHGANDRAASYLRDAYRAWESSGKPESFVYIA